MPRSPLPIANGYYVSDSLPISAQECTNVFPVVEEAPALVEQSLRSIPGLRQVATTTTDPCRGSYTLNGTPYFVIGDTLYRLESDETTTAITGTISGTGTVSIAENGTQLMIVVPGSTGYIFTESPDTLTEISDPDFTANGNPQAVVFIDGYFAITTDEKKFIISALNDGLSYNALDFGSAESSPDDVISPVVFKNQLFIGGSTTLEAFNNIGGANFPFRRVNLFLDQGPAGIFSILNGVNTFLFIGQGTNERPAVWQLTDNTTQRISTLAIDNLLLALDETELSGITSWYYSQGGHFFAGFNLPTTTIVYDFSTGLWHERKSRILREGTSGTYDTVPCRAVHMVSAYGKVYCGDSIDGRIGELSRSVYDEYGMEMIRTFATQPFQNNMSPFFVSYLELTVESGVGNPNDPDPQVIMERSRNGGFTFEPPRQRSMGKVGEYSRRSIWRRLGRIDRFDVYRFTVSDRVNFVGIQLTADIQ